MSLEREIDALFAVEPSPEFQARVRTRIAAEPAPTRFLWMWVPVGALAAALVIVALWPAQEHPAFVPALTLAAVPTPAMEIVPPPIARERRVAARAPDPGSRIPSVVQLPLGEILLSDGEARALAQLAGYRLDGRASPEPVAVALEAAIGPPEFQIASVDIQPLATIRGLEGERP